MMLADSGMNTWMPIATAANVAQGAAALAVAFRTRNKKTKAMALPASLSAFMGITEPAIFGVNVRFMRPFVAGMIGGACGGAVASILHVYATANGVTGLFGFLITTDCFFGYLLTVLVSFAVAFAISWMLGIKEDVPEEGVDVSASDVLSVPAASDTSTVVSPLSGEVVALGDVPDPTFAEGVLGQGTAIEPSGDRVVAPSAGVVSTLFDTHHAIGLTLDSGAELLIHIGINTVELNGEGFTACVAEGERVTAGQTLLRFDRARMAAKGYATVTPVIVTNADAYDAVRCVVTGTVAEGDALLMLKKE